jgi:hypothetical protein
VVRTIFKRLDRLEVGARTATSMNSTPHTLLWVGMDRQPVGGVRLDRTQKRYVDVDLSTLRWDADKKKWGDD